MSNILKDLNEYLASGYIQLKAPESADKVYKDECVYCFGTPFGPDGLYICLSKYIGVCAKHIDQYAKKTSSRLYLNIKKFKVPPTKEEGEEPKDKVQRLAIKQTEDKIESEHSLRFYPHISEPIPVSSPEIGNQLREICDLIIAHISAELQQRLESGISEWDGEERLVSKAAEDLVQINYTGPPISYEGWECAEPNCGLRENLWLNLSDGAIMCGRYTAMTGVKGNGHAKKHYEKTGFPLVVKLGTIENGDGDIYSYSEDAAVRDPWLKKHLAHFGLDIDKFKKTEKTTLEIELDANLKHEFSTIQEEGATLKNVYGPGFTGLINLGSSCYINSALQMLYTVPDFLKVYSGQKAEQMLQDRDPSSTYEDFNCQLGKVVSAMASGEYSKEDEKDTGIRPTVFRRIAGRGHAEFSTAKQQDAEEYVRHLFDKIDQNVRGVVNPVNAFRFLLVNRFVDELSGCVRYTKREDTILSLPIPMELCRESDLEIGGVRRKLIGLEQCLSKAFSEEYIEGYTSPVLNEKGRARQELRMGSFPDFLIIQIRRFAHTDNFEVKKLDVDVDIIEQIDLSAFFSSGELQPGEKELPPVGQQQDEKGLTDTQQQKITELAVLGFSDHQAGHALKQNRWDTNTAAEWLFMHADEVPPEPMQQEAGPSAPKEVRNGTGKYRLRAFISHMGSSPHSGHYVAHVKRQQNDDTWYIFNDEKVAISQNPPKSLGYLYMFERMAN